MKPVKQTDNATGGASKPFEKPMDKPEHQYLANETVPRDDFHEEPLDENFENPGDLSKRFPL